MAYPKFAYTLMINDKLDTKAKPVYVNRKNKGHTCSYAKSHCDTVMVGHDVITETPFDEADREIWNLLVKATNLFYSLEEQHPTAKEEWCLFVHGLQGLLEHRVCKRMFPDIFR